MATISGVWRWNDDISGAKNHGRIPIQFRSNGFLFYGLLTHETFSDMIYIPTPELGTDQSTISSAEMNGPWVYGWKTGWRETTEPFRTVDFGARLTTISDTFYTWITTYLTYVGESTWKPVYQASLQQNSWLFREAYQYIGGRWVRISPIFRSYPVNIDISGVEAEIGWKGKSANGSLDDTYADGIISEDGIYICYLTGTLPNTVNVTNASIVEWNKSTGRLVIDKPTWNVTIQAST
jgi:hypothetical protein